MSFLSIQGPGKSQFCGLCEREYLYDADFLEEADGRQQGDTASGTEGVRRDEAQNPEPEELPGSNPNGTAITSEERNQSQTQTSQPQTGGVSLITILLKACDVCIYCGGKFIG